jgi:hypothetical protein
LARLIPLAAKSRQYWFAHDGSVRRIVGKKEVMARSGLLELLP